MNLYKGIGGLIAVMMVFTGCQTKDLATEAVEASITQVETDVGPEVQGEEQDVEVPDMDREAITSRVYTIPRENAYSTGTKVISSESNALLNGDFSLGQSPWQINTIDGVVFDQGLVIQEQAAEMQQVILAQGIEGFEKMKSYLIAIEAEVTGEVPLDIKIKDVDKGTIYASVEFVLSDQVSSYASEFPMNYDLQGPVSFEVTIHTDKEDMVQLKDIQLTRKEGKLVWSDEFDVDGLPDSDKWGYDVGGNGWGNAERQYYTANDLDNAFVEGGILTIQSLVEKEASNPYTSARMVTRDTYGMKYKRVEVMAKLPSGIGTWPAIWMLSSNRLYGSWPASGEIDLMEHVGYDPNIIHGTTHTAYYNHTKNTQKSGLIYVGDSSQAFHRYTIDWTPYEIDFYVDDYLYFTHDNDGTGSGAWPFDQDFYLILNLAIGGGWGGQQGIDEEALPAAMEVDYVRVYDIPINSVDIEAPSAIEDIEIQVNGTLATIYWPQATDDYLVDHYDIYLDDQYFDSVEGLDYTFYSLDPSSSYSVGIVALDQEGNASELLTKGFLTETGMAQAIDTLIEAETAMINVGGVLKESEEITYIDYLDAGDYLVYEIDVPKAGKYDLGMRYSSLMSKGVLGVSLDGEKVIDGLELEANGSWSSFTEATVARVYLEEGSHFITLIAEASGFTVDYFTLQ